MLPSTTHAGDNRAERGIIPASGRTEAARARTAGGDVTALIDHRPSVAEDVPPVVRVELFGVPRLLAGARTVPATGSILGQLAADLGRRCPALAGAVLDPETGWLLDGYIFVVDDRFTRDAAHPLPPGASVLLVSSVAGG